MTDIYQ